MTSLFDQFEQALVRPKNNSLGSADLTNLGYIDVTLDQEAPIFTKSKKDFTPVDKITHVSIANKYMVVAMANSVLLRMNLHNPAEKSEILLTKYTQNKLSNLFLDPTGNHLLLTFSPRNKTVESPELMYLSRKSEKVKSTTKFRGNEFTAVGWNQLNDAESTTGPILLGTSKGLIFETEIVLEGDKFFASSLEQYWRQVFDIGKNTNTPITGLEYFQVIGTDKYMIFATTPTKFYYFSGKADSEERPLLQQIFQKYLNIPETETFMACESKLGYSRVQFWSENLITPNTFTWITEKGIHYGQIDPKTDTHINTIKEKTKLLEYPKPLYEDYSQSPKYPVAIAMTQFHILLAYSDGIKGMCLLNEEVVYEDQYNEAFGKLVSVVKDRRTGQIWSITENAMFGFKIHREERNIWQIFCINKQFDLAKKYSRGNQACYNQVLIEEADMLFEQKQYALSAQRYAETQSSFEEICLKFIQADQSDPLKIYLRNKLSTLKPQDKTQITMIVIWVVELYLTKLEEKRLRGMEKSAAYDDIQKEFETFMALQEVADCIKNNKATIYELMQSHGDKSNLIKLTIVNKDFEQLIRQHIFKNNFHDALEVLRSQNNLELYYQFAPILMQEIPKPMVKTLIDHGKRLVPLRLLPALVSCDGDLHALEVIRYLEYCINKLKNTDRAIHNFLLSLYAKYDSQKLMEYLNSQGEDLILDVHFALRLCTEYNLTEACVRLSGLLGLWESAVDLALKVNLDLAKKMTNMSPENDEELRKKLWLKIAQHVVREKDDIKLAMAFLQQCELIKIEDILPFFSDFVTIDHFKDAICNSLKEYNEEIKILKQEMEEASKSASHVRDEIHSFRHCYTYINGEDKCEICNVTLMIRPFYLFPCHHKFHSDCLLTELEPFLELINNKTNAETEAYFESKDKSFYKKGIEKLEKRWNEYITLEREYGDEYSPAKKKRLEDLEKQLKLVNAHVHLDNISTGSSGMSAKDQVKTEIDNIIASECLYCGENMIQNIDKPFL